MFYGLVSGKVQEPGYEFDHSLSDIQSLNEGALNGELDVTAISVHAYPYVAKSYSILACGASMGGVDYGPRVVATRKGQLRLILVGVILAGSYELPHQVNLPRQRLR